MDHDTAASGIGNEKGMVSTPERPAVQQSLQLGLGVGVAHVRCATLLGNLENARRAIDELIYNFDRLPEAYQPGSDLWARYDELTEACVVLVDAEARWVGS